MAKAQAYLVGIDGGGSGCRVAIADATGRLIAEGAAGPANASTDVDEAVRNVLAALAATGMADDLAEANAHVGLAGIMCEYDASKFAAHLPFARVTVTDDRPTTLAGALGGKDGLLAAVGTGSFVGVQADGKARFLGGWGNRIGDQASGAWAGRALLEKVLLAHDGLSQHTTLTNAVLAGFQGDPNAIVTFAKEAAPADLASFAPRIFEAARDDDHTAIDIVNRGAAYLDQTFALLDPGPGAPLCLTGGLGPLYRDWISPSYAARLIEPAGSALDGALLLAGRQT